MCCRDVRSAFGVEQGHRLGMQMLCQAMDILLKFLIRQSYSRERIKNMVFPSDPHPQSAVFVFLLDVDKVSA